MDMVVVGTFLVCRIEVMGRRHWPRVTPVARVITVMVVAIDGQAKDTVKGQGGGERPLGSVSCRQPWQSRC